MFEDDEEEEMKYKRTTNVHVGCIHAWENSPKIYLKANDVCLLSLYIRIYIYIYIYINTISYSLIGMVCTYVRRAGQRNRQRRAPAGFAVSRAPGEEATTR